MAFKINLGSLTVQIGADTEDFEQGQTKVQKGLKKTDSELRKSASDFAKWGAAVALAATVAVAAFAKSQLSAIKQLKNLSQAANTTVKEFQRGAFAAASVGIETEKYGDILKDVNDKIGDFSATGGGEMLEFFDKIAPKVGVTIEQFKNLSGQQALGLFIDTLQKANVSQQEMTFFMESIANDSTRLIPLLKDNAKAFKELSDEAKDLGIGLDDLDVIKASIANEEIAKSAAAIDSVSQRLTLGMTPAITGIIEAFNDSAKTFGGWEKVGAEAMSAVIKSIGFLWNATHGLKVVFKGVELAISVAMLKASEVMDQFRENKVKLLGQAVHNSLIVPMTLWEKALEAASKTSSSFAAALSTFKGAKKDLFAPADNESGFTQAARDGVEALKISLKELAAEEMPGVTLEKSTKKALDAFEEEVKKRAAAKKAADEAAAKKKKLMPKDSEVEVYKAESISLFEAMGVRFQTTEEIQISQNQRELELLKGKLKDGLIFEKEFKAKSLALEKSSADAQRNLMVSNMSGALSHFASNSKKMQKLQTDMQVISAVKSGYSAAVKAWDYGMLSGPWIAAAYAGASLVKTGALISKIKSGGKSQSSSGGGFSAPATNQGQARQSQQSQGASGPDRAIQINLTGGAGSLFTTEQVRNLIESINEQIGDGVSLGLAGA